MRTLLAAVMLLAARPVVAEDGAARFSAAGCAACHRVGPRGGDSGPDLTLVGARRPRAWLDAWLQSPRDFKHDTLMPQQGLSAADRGALAAWLAEQKGQAWGGDRPWGGLDGLVKGRMIYLRAGCVACHGPAGRGGHPNPGAHGGVIPALAPLMATYKAEEIKAKVRRGVVPEVHDGPPAAVDMPAWKDLLSDEELDALAAYLLTLADGQPKLDW